MINSSNVNPDCGFETGENARNVEPPQPATSWSSGREMGERRNVFLLLISAFSA
jgi:hypothetical protein